MAVTDYADRFYVLQTSFNLNLVLRLRILNVAFWEKISSVTVGHYYMYTCMPYHMVCKVNIVVA